MDDLLTTFWPPAAGTAAGSGYERHAEAGLRLEGQARRVCHPSNDPRSYVARDVLIFDVQPGHRSAPVVPVELWMRSYPDWLTDGTRVRVTGVLTGGTLCASMVEKSEGRAGQPARRWVGDVTARLCGRFAGVRQPGTIRQPRKTHQF